MKPDTARSAYIFTIWTFFFVADLVMVHGGLDLSHQLAVILMFAMGLIQTVGLMIADIKEKTERSDI